MGEILQNITVPRDANEERNPQRIKNLEKGMSKLRTNHVKHLCSTSSLLEIWVTLESPTKCASVHKVQHSLELVEADLC